MATQRPKSTLAETVKSMKSPLTVQVAAYSHTPWGLQLVLNPPVQEAGLKVDAVERFVCACVCVSACNMYSNVRFCSNSCE